MKYSDYDYDYENELDYTQKLDFNKKPDRTPQKSNTGLIVAVSILSVFLVVAIVVVILLATNVITLGIIGDMDNTLEAEEVIDRPIPVGRTMYVKYDKSIPLRNEPSNDGAPICQIPMGHSIYVIEYVNNEYARVTYAEWEGYISRSSIVGENPIVPVGRTMYVNCNVSLTLRNAPRTDADEIRQVPVGDALYVIEYINGDFARVTHNGTEGFVMKKYLANDMPNVWYYNEYDVEYFVESSLYAFVNGINTNDASYVYDYFTGDEAEQEKKTSKSISDAVLSEEILQVNCHSVERVSPVQVTVVRDSVIRVTYNDGSVKNVTEKYKYTVDYSKGRMYIVAIEKM